MNGQRIGRGRLVSVLAFFVLATLVNTASVWGNSFSAPEASDGGAKSTSLFLPEAYRTGVAYDYRFILRDESCSIGVEMLKFDIETLVRKILSETLMSDIAGGTRTDTPVVDPAGAGPYDDLYVLRGGDTVNWAGSAYTLRISSTAAIPFEGRTTDSSGQAVFGWATATSGTNYGGCFRSESTTGRGVYGAAAAASGDARGVYGWSNSTSGIGVSAMTGKP